MRLRTLNCYSVGEVSAGLTKTRCNFSMAYIPWPNDQLEDDQLCYPPYFFVCLEVAIPYISDEADINDAIFVSYGHIRCDLCSQNYHGKPLHRAVA